MNTHAQCEALLFAAGKPLTAKKIAEFLEIKEKDVASVIAALKKKYEEDAESGVQLADNGKTYQLMTKGSCAEVVEKYMKEEIIGELTRPSLETLTIIAYRGPITKPELEQIRGVNCSLILRNLALRGLIESEEDGALQQQVYRVTLEFLRYLGISAPNNLPDYQKLNSHDLLQQLLKTEEPSSSSQ
ncbi:MAG: Segregation and condensation protein B [Candidatus Magasanikbacteria bacterium GW2011_GWA2_45_39]|uniref:Segregation and condensation protein B n=2 Tax=Candidatus Magasanikiibacteriota TaxID=1752731 RepID=A0A0G1MZC7_9BACT|nr:MAG: Segregation and condensation protein B [Candidatus Magasanikbacteria bacterium GW2011_GWA2_45_39]KKU13721.1 MAG: Segregation and condensation protein B [Candidatus Magasanikbacteria bacterium GW2011_GWC2_45_8]HBW73654.1 SMC-Scp complex subunit ScpB [Candidatus Magasanikbacteria bacterium]